MFGFLEYAGRSSLGVVLLTANKQHQLFRRLSEELRQELPELLVLKDNHSRPMATQIVHFLVAMDVFPKILTYDE